MEAEGMTGYSQAGYSQTVCARVRVYWSNSRVWVWKSSDLGCWLIRRVFNRSWGVREREWVQVPSWSWRTYRGYVDCHGEAVHRCVCVRALVYTLTHHILALFYLYIRECFIFLYFMPKWGLFLWPFRGLSFRGPFCPWAGGSWPCLSRCPLCSNSSISVNASYLP